MSDESRLERSRQWFDAAINDLIAAKTLMNHGLFAHACFLSQQSAEKGMKGFVAIEKNPARSHSLGELLSALPQDARLIDLEPSRLDRFYPFARKTPPFRAGMNSTGGEAAQCRRRRPSTVRWVACLSRELYNYTVC